MQQLIIPEEGLLTLRDRYRDLAVRPWRMAVLVTFLAIPVALAMTVLGWRLSVEENIESMHKQMELLSNKVDSATMNSGVMGAVTMLGTYNVPMKLQALGELPPDAPEVTTQLKALVDRFNASNAFVMDKNGVIVAYVRQKGKSGLGKDLSFRPYFKQAIKGKTNVYAAVGSNSGKRGLYFAAPIYSTDRDMVWTNIIGIVAIKLDLIDIDTLFSQFASPIMLLSPQGVVFSTNKSNWFFTVTGEVTPKRVESIRKYKQFGKFFDDLPPASLPIDIAKDTAEIDGVQYALTKMPVRWNDPLGVWQLVMLESRPKWFQTDTAAIYGGGTMVICWLLGIALFFKLKDEHNRRRATRKLTIANKRLVTAMRAKNHVDRIMRHDLKNPLTVVITNPFILKNAQSIGEMELEMLEQIEVAGYTMLNMINSSMDMYKIERGTYHAKLVPFDLVKSLRLPLKQFSVMAEENRLNLAVTLDGNPIDETSSCMVTGVELLCYTALSNLIRNAMEASPDGGTISIALEKGDVCTVVISNQGAVPHALRDTFFEKYATADKEGGTGLGTYSAKLFIETIGGGIEMTTSSEAGTQITVQIPV